MKQRFTKRTRLVSALLTLAMVFTFLPFSAFAAAETYVPLYKFPDETFRKYLEQFDTDDDTFLSTTERNAVTAIDVNKKGITTLEGIEHFSKLETLFCSDNQLTSLDVSQNTELMWLVCKGNQLTELDMSSNPQLYDLSCGGNKLTSLNVSQNEKLQTLYCYNNKLTSLNVSKCTELYQLECYDNNLTSLDVSKNPVLQYLDCNYNSLASLDVSKNTTLQYLDCSQTSLTSLDVSKNEKLETLKCGWNLLTSLDVSGNTALQDLYCNGNKLSSLDVRKNEKLETLWCSENQLTELDVSKNTALDELDCDDNKLTSLGVSKNTALQYLFCNQNNLTSLDVSQTAVTTLKASGNQIDINVEKTPRTFNLSTLPGFDVSRASGWVGGDVDGNTLKVNENVTQVTYTYDCGKGFSRDFTLNVKVVPDGSTGGGSTGGGSTGGGSTGGGSTGGGSTGGSTGGGSTEAGKYQLTVTDGVATVNGSTGAVLNVTPGDTVTLTADTTKFPENEEFGWWEITPYGSVSNTLTGQYQRTATFTMPNENVSARAMSKSAGVSTGGDDGGGGGGAAILLVGGAAVAGLVGYGVYSYVSEQQLKALLPEGVAMPENRAQTALLLWNTAGRPEPAEAPAFKDVADPDTAKAAQWCVEHGLMDQKLGGRFAPDNSDPAYKTLNAYQQLVG